MKSRNRQEEKTSIDSKEEGMQQVWSELRLLVEKVYMYMQYVCIKMFFF